ncbi:MAG: YihY/virulence factor BrkB family protein [Hyphomicrobiales bacterium]
MSTEAGTSGDTARSSASSPSAGAWWRLLTDTVAAWSDDYASSMGAAIAYYTLFSIAPLLVIVTAVAGFLFGYQAVNGELYGQLRGLVGSNGAEAIQALVKSVSEPAEGIAAIIISSVLMVIGATGVFSELQSALDRIWEVPRRERSSTWMELVRTRILAFGMVLSLAFLLLVSLIVSTAIAAVGVIWDVWLGHWEIVLQLVNLLSGLVIFTVVFALIFRFLPRVTIGWRDVWLGALITSLLFVAGKFLIGLYIGKSGIVSGFGAAGSLVTLLIWVYYSAQIFLLGAEFTWIYAHRYGSLRNKNAASRG